MSGRSKPAGLCAERILTPLFAVMAFAWVAGGGSIPARAQAPTEYDVKAAFLFNFAKFVEWPSTPSASGNDPFTICTLGEDRFRGALDKIVEGKEWNGRPLSVRRLKNAQDARDCRILFISSSETARLPRIFESLQGASVLTVGETEGFTRKGGIINFTLEEDRVRFEINVNAARAAGLKISSRLLSLAKIIGGRGAGG